MKRGPFLLAIATTGATFILLLAGGTVHPTGSSLACPDWPTCYGSFFPEMKNGVEFEHTHRVIATIVGVMTIALAWSLWTTSPRSTQRRMLGLGALALVVTQGVLGGITVLLRLPLAVSASHLALSMIVFCYFLYLSFRLWNDTHSSAPHNAREQNASRSSAAIAAVVVYGQILLGALVRHMHAGRACNDDLPWCAGEIWPTWGPAQLHMLHRYGGVLTAIVVTAASVVAYRNARRTGQTLAARLSLAAPGLVALQVLVGVLTVSSGVGVVEATAHLGIGALLLADLVATYLAFGAVVPLAALRLPASEGAAVPTHEATT